MSEFKMLVTALDRLDQIMHQPPDVEMESYLDCRGVRCWRPKGEGERLRAENHARKEGEKRRHLESVQREAVALKLDEIDPDWPSKFLTTDQAARFYRDELAELEARPRPGIVVHSSPYEPPTVVDAVYRDPDEDSQ